MNDNKRELTNEQFYLILGVVLCVCVFVGAFNLRYWNRPIYTIEVYEIFEVVIKSNSRETLTCVYTVGQAQFFFRGEHEINESKAYTFVYKENGKRWRDLTLIEYWEINVLEREEDCPTCPE